MASAFLGKYASLTVVDLIQWKKLIEARFEVIEFSTVLLALFSGSRAWDEEREPGTHCSRMLQVSLVTCILLRYTKINGNFCLPAEGHTAE